MDHFEFQKHNTFSKVSFLFEGFVLVSQHTFTLNRSKPFLFLFGKIHRLSFLWWQVWIERDLLGLTILHFVLCNSLMKNLFR